ncbi:MAG TPA: hypothetical protein VIH26_10350 [Anaerolineales bacterium]
MQYPLGLNFKIMAFAPQISVTDATGQQVFYVKQKLFKLKEAVTVFADAAQTRPLYTINADRIIDFSAQYHFTDLMGMPLGSVKRDGMKSLWRSRYNILNGSSPNLVIREENPWIKVVDGLVGQIPVVGMFSGYVLHPAYLVSRADNTGVMRLAKLPAFFEGKFKIDKLADLSQAEETRILLSLLMMVLLERSRG